MSSSKKKKSWFTSDFDDFDGGGGGGGGGGGNAENKTFGGSADHSKMRRSNSGPSPPLLKKAATVVAGGGGSSAGRSSFQSRGSSLDDEMFKRKKRAVTDNDMWSVKHRPKSASDLATHPKKIDDLRQWLKHATSSSKTPKVLLLSGPAGCAKTATLSVLCRELKIEVQEWRNPNASHWEEGLPYEAQNDAFKRFVARALKYRALTADSDGVKKIVLIEEMPGFIVKDPEVLHQTLHKFKPGGAAPWPLVIIHSERNKSDTMKKLFPPTVLAQISHIAFNPIAATNLVKALSAVAMIESSYGVRTFKIPDKAEMSALAAKVNGDIRAAINALQFGCLEQDQGLAKKRPCSKPTKMANIGDKDSNFDLFHAMGKILYCKRHQDRCHDGGKLLPGVDRARARRPLQSDPAEVLEKSPMSGDPFTCFLHQNYLDFFTDIHQVSQSAEYLSAADPFFNEWNFSGKINLTDYGGLVSAMGLCYPRTQPVKVPGGALKTFSKPEHYTAMAKARGRLGVLSQPFVDRRLPNAEIATSLAPFFAKTLRLASETVEFREAVTFFPNSRLLGGTKTITVNPLERINNDGNVIQEEDCEDEEVLEYEDYLIEEF